MKINKYYGAAALLTVILIVVFTQRSEWNANKFILSADSEGNLDPKSEAYFDAKEKAFLAKVDAKLAQVDKNTKAINSLRGWLMEHTCHSGKYGGCDTIATHFRGLQINPSGKKWPIGGKSRNDPVFKTGL